MRVEYLVAFTDGTWTTVMESVPLDTEDREVLTCWAEENLTGREWAKDVALFAVYHYEQREEE